MAIAIEASVTVSILELMIGIAIRIPGTKIVDVSTSDRLRMDERLGTSKTSSKVKPTSGLNFIFHLQKKPPKTYPKIL
jgi:hypothetical protein